MLHGGLDVVTYILLRKKIDEVRQAVDSLTPGYTYKGSVNSVSDLPSDADLGDLYIVIDEGNSQYVWDGTAWRRLNTAAIDKLAEDIATVETSTSASHSYLVGEYFILGGQLYRVTEPISVDDVIEPEVNCVKTTLSYELVTIMNNLKWSTVE